MSQIEKLEEDSQRASFVRQMLKSKGWAVLKDRMEKRKNIYLEKMLKESTHDALLSWQGKINGINSLLEEIDNVIKIGNSSEKELEMNKRNTRR
jgi:hypothetical protein